MPQVTIFSDEITNQSKRYFEMKAGKMQYMPETRMVKACPEPGKIIITRTEDDLLKFEWKNLTTDKSYDSFVIMPGEVDVVHVKKVTDGRVFVLRFKQDLDKKFFYWCQDTKTDKDDENFKTLTATFENGFTTPTLDVGTSEMNELLNTMEPAQLVELLNTIAVPSLPRTDSQVSKETTATTPTVTSKASTNAGAAGGKIQLQDLQKVLATMPLSGKVDINLNDVIKLSNLDSVLSDPKAVGEIAKCLPAKEAEEIDQKIADPLTLIRENIRKSFFGKAASLFSGVYNNGEMAPIIGQFGFGDEVKNAAAKADWREFAKALEDEETRKAIKVITDAESRIVDIEESPNLDESKDSEDKDSEDKMDVDK